MDEINDAVRLIAAKSPQAAKEAIHLLRTPGDAPLRQNRYNRIAEWAVSDPQADFTPEERRIITSFLQADDAGTERAFMLRVRLTESEREELQTASEAAGMTMSEYARRKIFDV